MAKPSFRNANRTLLALSPKCFHPLCPGPYCKGSFPESEWGRILAAPDHTAHIHVSSLCTPCSLTRKPFPPLQSNKSYSSCKTQCPCHLPCDASLSRCSCCFDTCQCVFCISANTHPVRLSLVSFLKAGDGVFFIFVFLGFCSDPSKERAFKSQLRNWTRCLAHAATWIVSKSLQPNRSGFFCL